MADRTIRTFLRVEAADARRELRSIASEVERTGAAFDAQGKRIETFSGRLVRSARINSSEWRQVGTTLATIGTAGVAALGASAAAAIQWESAWTGVLKTVDGTSDQLERLESGLRRMATELPASHTEIAAVAEAAGQLGVKVQDVESFTRVMIDLGETTNLSAQDAATGLARFANVMGTSQGDISRLGSSLVGLGNNFATTEREILDMAQRLSAAAAVVGMSESDVLGLAAAMSSVGIEAEAGGSAVSRVMVAISKAVDEGGKRLEAFAGAAGMSSERFAAAWREDSANALLAVVRGLSQMTEAGEGAFGMLDELGLKDVRVTNALLSMANASEMTERALRLANEEWESNTALVEEAAKRYETTESRIAMAKNTIADAAIEIGGHMLPVVADLADGVAGLARWFGNLPDPVQRATVGLGGVVSVATLAAGGFALMVPRVVELYDSFQRIRQISPRAADAMGKVGVAVGKLAAAAAIAEGVKALAGAVGALADTKTAGLEATTSALLDMRDTTAAVDELFRDFGGGYSFSGFEDAFEWFNNPNLWDRINDFAGEVLSFGANEGSFGRTAVVNQIEEIGEALGRLVTSGNAERAEEIFDSLAEAWVASGGSLDELRSRMPAYTEALAAVENESRLAAEQTTDLGDTVDEMAAKWEEFYESIGMSAEEFGAWKNAAADASAGFIDLVGAYDAVIEKNRQIARETADATKSTKDSWEDYYDGVTVKIDDFIKSLEDQAAAQQAWEENMLTLAERVGPEMLSYLINEGPQASPLVEMLANASDEDLSKIETLYAEAGLLATQSFAEELAKATFEEIPVEANTTPAIAEIDEFMRKYNGSSIYINVRTKPQAQVSDDVYGPPAPAPNPFTEGLANAAPKGNPFWGTTPSATPFTPQAQANTFGSRAQNGPVMVLREHTVEQTSVFVDKLVAEDVDDFTQQATALRRGAAVAGMRAV